jgi:hypothetical protein
MARKDTHKLEPNFNLTNYYLGPFSFEQTCVPISHIFILA